MYCSRCTVRDSRDTGIRESESSSESETYYLAALLSGILNCSKLKYSLLNRVSRSQLEARLCNCELGGQRLCTARYTNVESREERTNVSYRMDSATSPGHEPWKCYFAWTKFRPILALLSMLNPKKKFILNPGTREYFSNFGKPCPTAAHCASNSWPLVRDHWAIF